MLLYSLVIVSYALLEAATIDLSLRRLIEYPGGSGLWAHHETSVQWPLDKAAVIISDMWDKHHCKEAENRVNEMACRMNEVIAVLRKKGALIIHCPSDTMDYYSAYPQRIKAKTVLFDGAHTVAIHRADAQRKERLHLPIDGFQRQYSEASWPYPWKKQIETIEIHENDVITCNYEFHPLLNQLGITHVIILGVHADECILYRPFGIVSLKSLGYEVVLMRDLTDSAFIPLNGKSISHYIANDLMIWYIEKQWCPTISSDQIIGGKPFRFAEDTEPMRAFADYSQLFQ
jgi:nicotinamidase-related amidase